MIFNGYTPSTLLPVFIVLAVIIGVLYLIRVRRRAVQVAYIGLWQQVLEKSSKKRWHDWLKRLISFLICMAVLGLIALALLDPRRDEDTSARHHAIIILDASASMAADAATEQQREFQCKTRFECAEHQIKTMVEAMKPTDRAVIIESSGIVSAVSGPFNADKSALMRTLSLISPKSTSTDIQKALDLAENLALDRKNPEIYLFTDGQFKNADNIAVPRDIPFEQHTFGDMSGNIAIDAFNVRRYIANRMAFEVFLKVSNRYDVPVTAKIKILNIEDDENTLDIDRKHKLLAEKTLTIASGESELRLYENLPLESSRMAAVIDIEDPKDLVDPMPIDNTAYARIPDYAKPDIIAVTPGNLYLEAALLLNENYKVTFVRPDDASIRNDRNAIDLPAIADKHDIVILDNSYHNLGAVETGGWAGRTIFIAPDKEYAPYKTASVINPVIERVNGKHPAARWLSLKNLNISKAEVFKGVANSDLVMRAVEGPVMATRRTENQRMLAIGFSLVESDLIFRIALPILFINAIDWLMNENDEPMRGFPTGSAWNIEVPDGIERVDVAKPDNSKLEGLPVYDNHIALYGENAGFYRIIPDNPKARTIEIAANFAQPDESDLSQKPVILKNDAPKPEIADENEETQSSLIIAILEKLPASSQYIWVLALLIALGLITVEWVTYHRRWTV